jgi:hypothetical protein
VCVSGNSTYLSRSNIFLAPTIFLEALSAVSRQLLCLANGRRFSCRAICSAQRPSGPAVHFGRPCFICQPLAYLSTASAQLPDTEACFDPWPSRTSGRFTFSEGNIFFSSRPRGFGDKSRPAFHFRTAARSPLHSWKDGGPQWGSHCLGPRPS